VETWIQPCPARVSQSQFAPKPRHEGARQSRPQFPNPGPALGPNQSPNFDPNLGPNPALSPVQTSSQTYSQTYSWTDLGTRRRTGAVPRQLCSSCGHLGQFAPRCLPCNWSAQTLDAERLTSGSLPARPFCALTQIGPAHFRTRGQFRERATRTIQNSVACLVINPHSIKRLMHEEH
jgi:hypothetical protein